jgi:hypothetical protein
LIESLGRNTGLGVQEQATTRASPFGRHFQGVFSIHATQG